MCGNLEDYVSTTAKVSKSQSKDYEKILKVGVYSSPNRDPETDCILGDTERERPVEGKPPFQYQRWRCGRSV